MYNSTVDLSVKHRVLYDTRSGMEIVRSPACCFTLTVEWSQARYIAHTTPCVLSSCHHIARHSPLTMAQVRRALLPSTSHTVRCCWHFICVVAIFVQPYCIKIFYRYRIVTICFYNILVLREMNEETYVRTGVMWTVANRTRGDVYVSRVPAWQGLVSIVAIIVSAALVACIVFVACHHRISSRHKKNSQRTQVGSIRCKLAMSRTLHVVGRMLTWLVSLFFTKVRQALLSPDVANASPTHGGVVIDDDMMCEVKVATSKTAEGSARMSTRGASAEPLLLMSPDRGNVMMYTTGDPSRCKHARGHHHRPHRSSTRYSLRGLAAADEERRLVAMDETLCSDNSSETMQIR